MKAVENTILRSIVVVLFFIHSVTMYAQYNGEKNIIGSFEKTVSEFENIAVDQNFNLYIFEGTSNTIIVEADLKYLDKIYVEESDGTLNIGCMQKIVNSKVMNIFIATKNLKKITCAGKSEIKIYPNVSKNLICNLVNETSHVKLKLAEKNMQISVLGFGMLETDGIFNSLLIKTFNESKIKMDISANIFKCYMYENSYAYISGLAKKLIVTTQNHAVINTYNMFAEKCELNAADISEVYVNATEELYITGTNKSYVEYKGEPLIVLKSKKPFNVKNKKDKNYFGNK